MDVRKLCWKKRTSSWSSGKCVRFGAGGSWVQ